MIGGTMVLRHSDLDHPVVARSGRFAAGYRARSVLGPLGYDLGYEFGFGEPSGFEFARSGLFNGLNAALSLNIVGTEPSERRFHLIEISYDVVLQVDGGAWMGPPPDSSVDELPGQVYFEGAVHLGLRFNLESDMFLGASS
ncbi:MAG: hypothetical protein HYV07_03545 [Deltaproteobacteria bacterium]|nr:hypothetical protein [Deltaproteobacteria bacterium]